MSISDHLRDDNYALLTVPPGSGKTIILGLILLIYPDALIIARTNFELCYAKDIIAKVSASNNNLLSRLQFTTIRKLDPSIINNYSLCVWYNIYKQRPENVSATKILSITGN